ncbi:MAG TPA: hypothetical protein ENH12_08170 [Proteobacteria bacterium]|nr:hypothetical protein [Pseudomonadota bacterium]
MLKSITKEDFFTRVGELSNDFEIIGPMELPLKGIFYQSILNTEDLYLGDGFAIEPIKKFFLEPSTRLLRYPWKNEPGVESFSPPERERIAIGVRPCEAKGLVLLDSVFDPPASSDLIPNSAPGAGKKSSNRAGSTYQDAFYTNNRKRTIIVGLACGRPDRCCFCTSLGGSPAGTTGMDVLLFEIEGGFAIEIITDRGKGIFGALGKELSEEEKKLLTSVNNKREDLLEKKIRVPESMDTIFTSDYWDKVSRSCISCGICTYLCPTCHCFDLIDERRIKLRCYDGCSFPHFTLHASGENPRPTKKERYRQRVFHKFDYFKINFGENLCVGCGRCIRFCPVKIDIGDIVDKAPLSKKR